MKTFLNQKKIIFISLLSLLANPCMGESLSPWKKVDANAKKEDCVNCYADLDLDKKTPKVLQKRKEAVYVFSDTATQAKSYDNNGYKYKIAETDTNPKALEFHDKAYVNTEHKSTIQKIAIQVGAFRHYAGAKKYVKKYAILSSKYKVTIKTGAKDQKPLYRVRIEGFSSKSQAKEFKRKYGLTGAFLVMK